MRRALAILLGIFIGIQPGLLQAQQAPAPPAQVSPVAAGGQTASASKERAQASTVPSIDALGVSFERIKRQLGEHPASANKTPLVLNYYVEVTAKAPEIRLFTSQELTAGPVAWGPPTHSDILNLLTRQEFRSPAMPISSLAIMGVVKLIELERNRLQRQRAEDARKKRDDEERERQRRLQESILGIRD